MDAAPAPALSDAPQQMHTLATMPRDVQLCILARCSSPDLAAVAVTCSSLRSVAQTDELWRSAADRALAWKPALAPLLRSVIAHTSWMQLQSRSAPMRPGYKAPAPAAHSDPCSVKPWPEADGGEWLLTRTGSRLRLLSIQLRHTQLGVPESCLSFCWAMLQLWLDQGQPIIAMAEATAHSDFALRNTKSLQHFLQAFRLAATLVADSIALQLRALLIDRKRMSVEQPWLPGRAWSAVHAAAAAYNTWLRSAAAAVGSMHFIRAGVDPLGDLNMARGGAAAFRSQVLLAYHIRGELQRCAAQVIWRLHSLRGGRSSQTSSPAADTVLVRRLALECSSSAAVAQTRQLQETAEDAAAAVAAMAQLLDAFDVADERCSYWWNRESTHAGARLRRHFGFVLRAGQHLSDCA